MNIFKSNFSTSQTNPTLAYLDNASTTQTPQIVLDKMNDYYTTYRSNIHRGIYDLSVKATEEYENARAKIARFINAEPEEIVFTSGTTHGLNLLARQLNLTCHSERSQSVAKNPPANGMPTEPNEILHSVQDDDCKPNIILTRLEHTPTFSPGNNSPNAPE
jgi:selenocysteine lyase/cysteine desulfurase